MNVKQVKQFAIDYILLKNNSDIADSYWVTLKNNTGTVEGKIHIPHNKTDRLLIFEPGFPGSGSGYFEKTMLRQVLEDNYGAFFIRHVGTIINGEYSAGYIACREKQQQAKKSGQKVLGTKKSHTIADWLIEPQVALEILAPYFENVVLGGHSFGPLASFSSLINLNKNQPKLAEKVKRFISMSGTMGIVREPKGPILSQWEEYLDKDWGKKRVFLGNTKENVQTLHNTYNKIHKEVNSFPTHTQFIAIHVWGNEKNTTDELVHVVESLDMITSLGRGYLIIDKTEYGTKDMKRIAHDMENLKPELFSKLINLNWLPNTQISMLK